MSLTFSYRARTPGGERVAGTLRALDRSAALATLRRRLLVPSRLERLGPPPSLVRLFRGHASRERLAFYRAYAALEGAGVDFSTAFRLLGAQARSHRFREALAAVCADVELGGDKLYEALANRPDDFADLEVAMVAAGEEAGNRAEIFDRLATLLERDERLRKQLQAALAYPALALAAAAAVIVFLFVSVLPEFATLFEQFGVERGPLLAGLLRVARIAGDARTAAVVAPAALAAFAFAWRALRTPNGALALDRVRLRVPLFGEAAAKAAVARIARVLAMLMQSGVNHLRCLEIAVPVAESAVYARAVAGAREQLATGLASTLDEALAASAAFEPLAIGFVRVGSRTGDVPGMLLRLAAYYEDDAESLLAAIPTIVQTAVTLGLGAVVALIMYVVYVPLSSLAASIR